MKIICAVSPLSLGCAEIVSLFFGRHLPNRYSVQNDTIQNTQADARKINIHQQVLFLPEPTAHSPGIVTP